PLQVSSVIVEFSSCLKQVCSKVVHIDGLDALEKRIVVALCRLEMLFPPSFFTVMVHLVVHLVEEVRLGGPVYYRWMYPIERFLGKLKSFVRNRSQPEGSIAEVWVSEEIFTFTSLYYEAGIETRFNRGSRLHEQVEDETRDTCMFPSIGRHVGGEHPFKLSDTEWLQTHRHVLIGATEVGPFLREFQEITRQRLRGRPLAEVEKAVHRDFVQWFRTRILHDDQVVHSKNLRLLARGPLRNA
ncbi:hypothetical protein LINPERHAP1_LOCUS28423, partial [Linum perenne]